MSVTRTNPKHKTLGAAGEGFDSPVLDALHQSLQVPPSSIDRIHWRPKATASGTRRSSCKSLMGWIAMP
jgi:hypothetical protein